MTTIDQSTHYHNTKLQPQPTHSYSNCNKQVFNIFTHFTC